jgi:lipopolysaccharide export system permease protein
MATKINWSGMSILTRYILRRLMAPLLFGLTALTGVMLLSQVAKQFSRLVGKGLPWSVITEVFALSLPFILAMTLPMAVCVAVLYAVSTLASDAEVTACLSVGISPWRICRPILAWGAVIGLVAFAFVDQVLPRSNARLRNLWLDIARKKPTFELREEVVNTLAPSPFFLKAARINAGTGQMRNVTIYDVSGSTLRRIVYADSGLMGVAPDGHDLTLMLWDGTIHQVKAGPEHEFTSTRFRTNDLRVRDVFDSLSRSVNGIDRSDRELSTCEMLATRDSSRFDRQQAANQRRFYLHHDLLYLTGQANATTYQVAASRRVSLPAYCRWWAPWMSDTARVGLAVVATADPPGPPGQGRLTTVSEVIGVVDRYTAAKTREDNFLVEIHKKFSLAVACFTFVILGAPLALRFPRGGMGLVIGGGLAVFSTYYSGLTAGEALANRELIGPAFSMWASNALIGVVGIILAVTIRHGIGNTRGGDIGAVRAWFSRLTRRQPS